MFCKEHHENHKPCYKTKIKEVKTKKKEVVTKKGSIKPPSKNILSSPSSISTVGYITKKGIIIPMSSSDSINNTSCEIVDCGEEVFAACHRCLILLCWDHFDKNENCNNHVPVENQLHCAESEYSNGQRQKLPEEYTVEGGEDYHKPNKSPRKNKRKLSRQLRNIGEEYVNPVTKKVVIQRNIKPCCNQDTCRKFKKDCFKINDQGRLEIFNSYYNLRDLQLQREFIVRHIDTDETKQKTTSKDESGRSKTHKYFFTYQGERLSVCKTFFLNTLSISERTTRTAIQKVTKTGVVESDLRGGRSHDQIEKDKLNKTLIEDHINRVYRTE